jgi:hypothetical protein
VERLELTGVSFEEAERLAGEVDRLQLEQLSLDHRSEREDWSAGELRDARNELARQRSADLGEDAYDRMLYAAGQNNHVAVSEPLSGGPAATADLESLDVILSDAGEPIYTMEQLRVLARSGTPGEPVAVEVLRNGERVRAELPRGLIGIQMLPFAFDSGGRQSFIEAMRDGQRRMPRRAAR